MIREGDLLGTGGIGKTTTESPWRLKTIRHPAIGLGWVNESRFGRGETGQHTHNTKAGTRTALKNTTPSKRVPIFCLLLHPPTRAQKGGPETWANRKNTRRKRELVWVTKGKPELHRT